MDAASDEDLVRRIASRDGAAMRALYGRHHVRVYRFLLRMVRNEANAEDLMSDVFVEVWQGAGGSRRARA